MAQANSKSRSTVPPFIQLILIGLSIPLIGYAFYRGLTRTANSDPKPHLLIMTPEKIKAFGGYQSTIKVGLYINQFQTFDIIANNFVFTGIVWFQFNPGVISIDTLSKFSFERGKILDRSEPTIRLIDDQLLVRYKVRVQFNSELSYNNFPLDNHRLFIILSHNFVTPSEIIFDSSERNFIIDAEVAGWNLVDQEVETGYEESAIDKYDKRVVVYEPRVLFELIYSISGIRNILSILLPLILLFFLLSFSLSVDPSQGISLSAGGITAILAYRFVIEKLSPNSGVFMLSDQIFFLFLAASFYFFFINVLGLVAIKMNTWLKTVLLILIYIVINGMCLYLFWS